MITAAVAEAKFGNAASEAFLAKAIAQRRLRILQAFLPKVNPLVDVAISDGRLTFRNIAVEAAVGGPEAWARPISVYFRRNSGRWTLVGLERLP